MRVGTEAGVGSASVREALRGDAAARERLFEDVYARLLRYHRKLAGGDAALAEELAQETMVRVLRSFAQLRDPERFIPWVFRIATNAWRDHRRRKSEAAPAGPEVRDGAAERDDLSRKVLGLLEKLPEPYRSALTLRYLEDLDYDAMSEILDVAAVTLRSHVARGRQMIRRQLEDVDP
jgi:RNA polymerase sigma-70 factor (ECF subfamily)